MSRKRIPCVAHSSRRLDYARKNGARNGDKRGEMERLPERPKKIVTTPYLITWQSLLDMSHTPFFLSFHHPTRAAFFLVPITSKGLLRRLEIQWVRKLGFGYKEQATCAIPNHYAFRNESECRKQCTVSEFLQVQTDPKIFHWNDDILTLKKVKTNKNKKDKKEKENHLLCVFGSLVIRQLLLLWKKPQLQQVCVVYIIPTNQITNCRYWNKLLRYS